MIALDNLPGVAQVAIQGAKYAAKEIDNRLKGKPSQGPFHYFDKGSMAIISRFRAVALIGKLRLTGVLAWLMWLARAPHLHHRLQEPGHRAAALGRLVPRPRPLRAHHHRAADLRPQRARAGSSAAPPTWSPTRGRTTPRGPMLETTRRAELEAQALEEARLTDAGERGVPPSSSGSERYSKRRRPAPRCEPSRAPSAAG